MEYTAYLNIDIQNIDNTIYNYNIDCTQYDICYTEYTTK